MKTIVSICLMFLAVNLLAGEGGLKVGDKASDFKLKNVDGKYISLADFSKAKGFVVVFTCNNCPYAVAYQDRLISLDQKYKAKGYPVVAINPNDPAVAPGDSYDAMVTRAKDKGYTFPYLYDDKHAVYKSFGATNTPHIYILQKNAAGELIVKYIGTIDDNYQDANAVQKPYIENALDALLNNKEPDPSFTKAIGCSIKAKPASAQL
jgi:peroxiredoxin